VIRHFDSFRALTSVLRIVQNIAESRSARSLHWRPRMDQIGQMHPVNLAKCETLRYFIVNDSHQKPSRLIRVTLPATSELSFVHRRRFFI
jgi:hypothetical protein